MLLGRRSVPGQASWSLGPLVRWLVESLVGSGDTRFGARRIVLAHAGSTIPSTAIVGITPPVDGIIIKLIARPGS